MHSFFPLILVCSLLNLDCQFESKSLKGNIITLEKPLSSQTSIFQSKGYYNSVEGQIGNREVIIDITKNNYFADEYFSGFFYYKNEFRPIFLHGYLNISLNDNNYVIRNLSEEIEFLQKNPTISNYNIKIILESEDESLECNLDDKGYIYNGYFNKDNVKEEILIKNQNLGEDKKTEIDTYIFNQIECYEQVHKTKQTYNINIPNVPYANKILSYICPKGSDLEQKKINLPIKTDNLLYKDNVNYVSFVTSYKNNILYSAMIKEIFDDGNKYKYSNKGIIINTQNFTFIKLENIIIKDSIHVLSEKIMQTAKTKKPYPLTLQNSDRHFFLTYKGICFINNINSVDLNDYQLEPYTFIPYDSLHSCLTPDFKIILGIK